MTALPQDEVADLSRLVAELEQRLESSFVVYDEAIARQAALAQENARLQSELATAGDREAASAEILRTISEVSGDAERSLQQIVEITARLFGASSVRIRLAGTGGGRSFHVGRSSEAILATVPGAQGHIGGRNLPGTVLAENRQIHVADLDHIDPDMADWPGLPVARAAGTRTISGTPLRREGNAIGALIIHRDTLMPFTETELALQQSFADQAAIAVENARLFNETQEALERQTATADILKVIAASPSDVQPVFDALVNSAARLFGPCGATITTLKDGKLHWNATGTSLPDFDFKRAKSVYPIPFDPDRSPSARAILERRIIEIPDVAAPDTPEFTRQAASAGGFKSITFVPLVSKDQGIGSIILNHPQAGFRLSEHQLALVQTFADQAVIAIENARLFNETKEALERQTATADILKVIAASPSDVQPVFDAIAASANRLIAGFSTTVFRFIDGQMHLKAFTRTSPAGDEMLQSLFPRPLAGFPIFELVSEGETAQFADTEAESVPPEMRDLARSRGFRSMLFTPLMSNGASIGMIGITRPEPGAFPDHHVQLLQTFADQAVIAIENARLFDEVQARTNDLGESLQQQTATADVLKVISRSVFDLQTVLDTLVESAYKLCGADLGLLYLRGDEAFECKAIAGAGVAEASRLFKGRPILAGRGTAAERVILTGEIHNVPDFDQDPEFDPNVRAFLRRAAEAGSSAGLLRSTLAVPMTRDSTVVGVMVIARTTTGPFPARQVELLQTFADQAVIAIENVRLFDEVQAKTADLSESLQQQTATADVLKVISRSAFDLQTVLETLTRSAVELSGAMRGAIFLRDGDLFRFRAASSDLYPEWIQFLRDHPQKAGRNSAIARSVANRQTICVPDVLADPEIEMPATSLASIRAVLAVPLVRDGKVEGVMVLSRPNPGPFNARQIDLVQTFADQAVIAIENVRLFDEVEARTRDLSESLQQQTATADVLKVISRSAFDLQTVLDTLVESAARLCEADEGTIFQPRDDAYRLVASCGLTPGKKEFLENHLFRRDNETTVGRVLLEGRAVHLEDTQNDPSYKLRDPDPVRTRLGVPLLREGAPVGVFVLTRREPRPFTAKQIDLVQTFADQAVIAIENVRLFDEVQARTRDLSESLQQQTATAEVLKVISRSTFDLQTVLETLITSAVELSGANRGAIFLREGDVFPLKAASSTTPEFLQYWAANPPRAGRGSATERVIASGKVEEIHDVLTDPEMKMTAGALVRIRGTLGVPMLRDNKVEGVLVLTRPEPGPFTKSQIDLVQTFADQAVIAVENVRLFDETQARTRELAASLEELRTAQDRLVQTEKLASLGQLTAGIAHEIKNPLNFVNNFSSLSAELTDELNDVLKTADLADKVRSEVNELTGLLKDNLQKVVQHGKRADSIVKNMLLHSREGSGDHRPADINALLDESLNLAYHGARAEKPQFNVTLQRDFDANAGMIEVFPQEITRVFLNLIGNGFYAVAKRKADSAEDFDPVVSAVTKNLGDHVEIRIRDNGTGIPPEVKEKMFNPFFTTKPAGEGTGLGLSMSHDIIVKQHGGSIDVATEPGQFTEFTVRLPRTGNISDKK